MPSSFSNFFVLKELHGLITCNLSQCPPVKEQVLGKAGGQGVCAQPPRRVGAKRHWNDWCAWWRELSEPAAKLQHAGAICKATCSASA